MLRATDAVCLRVAILALLAIGIAPTVWGQSQESASIQGKVTDDSGAVVPNVAVEATSPALQVPKVGVTDSEGTYKLLDLPPGQYRVAFVLQGFQTFVHEGLDLTVGFTARVDAVLKIGAVSQSVEVTGAAPVVDAVSTTGQTTLVTEDLQNTPKGGALDDLLPLSTGVSMQGKPDVGNSNLGNRETIVTYGVGGNSGSGAILEPTLDLEGINIATSHDGSSAVYLNAFSVAEAEFKTSGNNADVAFPGVDEVAVMRSGSNSFHGRGGGDYENPDFQGNNITAALAGPPNNLKVSNPLQSPGYYDYSVGIGGRIIRDKLWFFGAISNQVVTQGTVNGFAKPDAAGCWTCSDAVIAHIHTDIPQYDGKVSYQLNHSTQIIGAVVYSIKLIPTFGVSSTVPAPSTNNQNAPQWVWKGEVQSAPSTRWLFDVSMGLGGYHVNYTDVSGATLKQYGYDGSNTDVAGDPSQEELSTKLVTGPDIADNNRPQWRYELNGSASFIPSEPHLGGTHQLKFGTTDDWEIAGTAFLKDRPSGDYQLFFNHGVPDEINVYNYPFPNSINHLHSQAGYVTETYTRKRVTINAGVRLERYDNSYPTQAKPAGQFAALFPAKTFPGMDVLIWRDIVPRLGAAWDVRGDGKTVVKGFAGIFGDTMGDLWANGFNPDAQNTNLFTWTGPCYLGPSGNYAFEYDEYKCDANPAFLSSLTPSTPLCTAAPAGTVPCLVSTAGGLTQLPNPNLRQDKTREYDAKLERQLGSTMALNVDYVYHALYDLYDSGPSNGVAGGGTGINVGRPLSSYTAVATFADTGNGSTPGNIVSVATYPLGAACNVVCTNNENLNNPHDRPDIYHTVAVSVIKRNPKKWDALASFWVTKNHAWIQAYPSSPNDELFPIDNTWNWEARGTTSYTLPKGFIISGLFRSASGTPGQRTEVFTGTGLNGQKLNQGSVTLRMGPFGAYRGPVIEVLNVKGAKQFHLGESRVLEVNIQVYNILNSSSAVATTYLTGGTFGVVSSIESPRIAEIGGSFSF